MKYATLNSVTKKYNYPFASYPCFKFWMYDRIRRHRSLDQAKVYMKQNPGDTYLTLHELKQGISSGDCNGLIKRMPAYAVNFTGSDSYLSNRRSELEATFEQKAPARVFFTFSYADNHWKDYQRLMPRHFKFSLENLETPTTQETVENSKYQDFINNPHLVDWYFGYRLNKFLEIVFDGILEREWRWHRFE